MLNSLTTSGNVRFMAMRRGTPSSSMLMLGSGVMTVRAEKSTRLPMRLPRMRPSLWPKRSLMVLKRRPVRSLETQGPELSMSVATCCCRAAR